MMGLVLVQQFVYFVFSFIIHFLVEFGSLRFLLAFEKKKDGFQR